MGVVHRGYRAPLAVDRLSARVSGEVLVDHDKSGGGGSAGGLQGIRVDLASFQVQRDVLENYLTNSWDPSVRMALGEYGADPAVGAKSPSANLAAFRDQYGVCVQGTVDRLVRFIAESGVLVEVASQIMNRYHSVDELRAVSVQDITDMLGEASHAGSPESGSW